MFSPSFSQCTLNRLSNSPVLECMVKLAILLLNRTLVNLRPSIKPQVRLPLVLILNLKPHIIHTVKLLLRIPVHLLSPLISRMVNLNSRMVNLSPATLNLSPAILNLSLPMLSQRSMVSLLPSILHILNRQHNLAMVNPQSVSPSINSLHRASLSINRMLISQPFNSPLNILRDIDY
jgi:hypothetical protein